MTTGATPATLEDVVHLVRTATPTTAAVVALAWLRAGRMGDILNLRQGGLWAKEDGTVAVEQPPTKALRADGSPDIILIAIPPWAEPVLRPLVAEARPRSRPLDRPPLFTATREGIVREIRKLLPLRGLTAHSFRKGAVARLTASGADLEDVRIMTRHRTREALAHYTGMVPAEAARKMRYCGRLLRGTTATPTKRGSGE